MDPRETDNPPGVRAHVLCKACDRIRNESRLIRWLSDPTWHEDDDPPIETEDFHHSWSLDGMLDAAASGCHICTLVRRQARRCEIEGDITFSGTDITPGSIFVKIRSPRKPRPSSLEMSFIVMEISDPQVFPEGYTDHQICLDNSTEYDKLFDRGLDSDVPILVFAWLEIHKQRGMVDNLWVYTSGTTSDLMGRLTDGDIISPQPASTQEYYPSSTGSSDALDLASAWLGNCLEAHDECNRVSLGANGKLPTRLVELNEVDEQLVARLIITPVSANLAHIQYCTLSHVWAATVRGSGRTVQLLPDNIEQLQRCIPVGELPRTFQEAMKITRRLGYQYIWIDSLCIIQDPTDITDFEREAVTMCDVYSNSSCNIAAVGLGNDLGSSANTNSPVDFCFTSRNPLDYVPCRIAKLNKNEAIYVGLGEQAKGPLSLRKSPLVSRAWVFQERFLSPRILYFGAELLYWECRCYTRFESRLVDYPTSEFNDSSRSKFLALCGISDVSSYPDSVNSKTDTGVFNIESGSIKEQSDGIINTGQVDGRLITFWHRIIEHYTETGLTYATDRLIALAGIVKAIKNRSGLTYAAGTWLEFWPFDLLWKSSGSGARRSEGTSRGTNLPSWSWVSTEGPKEFYKVHIYAGKLSAPETTLLQVVKFSCPTFEEQHHGDMEMTVTVRAFTKYAKVTCPVEHPLTRRVLHCIQFEKYRHDYLEISWDEEPTEGDSVLVIPLVRWEEGNESVCTMGLILMQDNLDHNENGERRYRRVGLFYEHGWKHHFTIFSGDLDVNEREEICLC